MSRKTKNGWSTELLDQIIAHPHDPIGVSDADFIQNVKTMIVRLGLATGINVNIGYTFECRRDYLFNFNWAIEQIEKTR
jgi:hypothetical protein